jgi:hypothetical protein
VIYAYLAGIATGTMICAASWCLFAIWDVIMTAVSGRSER